MAGFTFKGLDVYINLYGHRVLTWYAQGYLPSTYTVKVWRSRSGTDGDWTEIASLTDACTYTDTQKLTYNKSVDLCYKVSIGDNYSCSQKAGYGLSWPYDTQTSAVLKACNTEIESSGRGGWLLKQREWGTQCPTCADFGTGKPMDPHCPTCHGTGIQGGYYKAIYLPIIYQNVPAHRITQTIDNLAVDHVHQSAKCIAYPIIHRDDVWVGENINDRYVIEQVNVLSEMKGVPLIYGLEMKLAPQTSMIYSDEVTSKIEETPQQILDSSMVSYTGDF